MNDPEIFPGMTDVHQERLKLATVKSFRAKLAQERKLRSAAKCLNEYLTNDGGRDCGCDPVNVCGLNAARAHHETVVGIVTAVAQGLGASGADIAQWFSSRKLEGHEEYGKYGH